LYNIRNREGTVSFGLASSYVDEGDDWSDYHGQAGREKYIKALESSVTYLAWDENLVCGYARCREDDGFGVYIYDLLVRKTHRGRQIGKSLIRGCAKTSPISPSMR